jgi:hypothetical protein
MTVRRQDKRINCSFLQAAGVGCCSRCRCWPMPTSHLPGCARPPPDRRIRAPTPGGRGHLAWLFRPVDYVGGRIGMEEGRDASGDVPCPPF